MLLQPQLDSLKKFIMTYNPYFDNGFSDVAMDDNLGIINDGQQVIFPSDYFGNYFYIRKESKVTYSYIKDSSIADNYLSLYVSVSCKLVMYMDSVSSDALMGNIISTLGRYDENIRIHDCLYHAEDVILQELSRLAESKDIIGKALQSLSENISLTSISFTLSFPFSLTELNCIKTPCRIC